MTIIEVLRHRLSMPVAFELNLPQGGKNILSLLSTISTMPLAVLHEHTRSNMTTSSKAKLPLSGIKVIEVGVLSTEPFALSLTSPPECSLLDSHQGQWRAWFLATLVLTLCGWTVPRHSQFLPQTSSPEGNDPSPLTPKCCPIPSLLA